MIGIGEYRVGSFPMMTIGLGSCIGLIMFDPNLNLGAMVHIMLPESSGRMDRPGKYADTAVTLLVRELNALGCKNRSIIAKMIGGASMFEYFGTNLNIGERNAEKVRMMLKEHPACRRGYRWQSWPVRHVFPGRKRESCGKKGRRDSKQHLTKTVFFIT
jgi:chemotaxis protein CheD